ncbi:hypothetical protein [Kitasatospora sp. LaBMicrA B282]|uniref:hypothetical protein n=1 Tax=Kitasatospora sp. LaBMicrA B282 TaxID=3420949 RepID=UPI003D128AD6
MAAAPQQLRITVRPSPLAAGFHHLLTFPVVELDGVARRIVWGAPTALPLTGPQHRLSVYFRYRGQRSTRLGEGRAVLETVAAPAVLEVRAQLGVRNSSTFRITGPGVGSRR